MNPFKLFQLAASEKVALQQREKNLLGTLGKTARELLELQGRMEKIEAECMRGLSLERNCRSVLNTIFMLAHKGTP